MRRTPLLLGAGAVAGAFGLAWSRGAIPLARPFEADLTGKVAVVTGANSGIGLETAFALAAMGAHVVMACRSFERATEARDGLLARRGDLHLTVMEVDLSDLASVRDFSERFLSDHERLDILVNNAGRVVATRRENAAGHEETVATNHLGPFLLTTLLLDRITHTGRAHGQARIVNVASSTHRRGQLDLEDLMWEQRPYRALQVYGASKLMNVLFTMSLATRVDHGEVAVNCLHPGNITTGFGVSEDAPTWMRVLFPLSREVFLTPERGADTSIWLAASPEAGDHHAGYFFRRRRWQPAKVAKNPEICEALWQESLALTTA